VSAIFGIYRLDGGAIDRRFPTEMASVLAHRGPDGCGQWGAGPVSLGHRMLHTTTESLLEKQPLVDPASGIVVVADARIDNRSDLAAALGISPAAGLTDSEWILRAYLRWGSESPTRLVGDFAFAVWDAREHVLFCARDPMGVKPFYYSRSDRHFAFATEIKALHCLPEVPRELEAEQVAVYLAWGQPDREGTLYRGIKRLPAGHRLTVSPDVRRAPQRYWNLDSVGEIRYSNPLEYVEQFREIFTEAVRCRLRSVGPIATALSGGLDSSAVTCTARSLTGDSRATGIHAISLVFPGLSGDDLRVIDERRYVDRVVEGGGLHWHPVDGAGLSPLQEVDRVLWHLDEPYSAPNLYLHWGMYREAQANGAGVFLDGFDGDSTVSHGMGRLNGLLLSRSWGKFETEVRQFATHRGIDPGGVLAYYGFPRLQELARRHRWRAWGRTARELTSRFDLSRRDVLFRHGLTPAVPQRLRSALGSMASRKSPAVLNGSLARFVQRRENDSSVGDVSTERDSHLAGLGQPAYQQTLEIADKCAAAFGIEPRYPFFDRRLIEFCVAMPEEQKFSEGWSRLLFRKAMEGVLPSEVQWRSSKANLAPNFHDRFRAVDRPVVEQSDLARLEPYVDLGALRDTQRRFFGDANRQWGDPDAYLLFRTTSFAIWQETRNSRGARHAGDRAA
jgi:asparagine synthase (glutamine-hydrolysing)